MTPDLPFWRRRLLPVFLGLLAVNLIALAAWTLPRTLRLRNATVRVEAAREAVENERAGAASVRERSAAMDANAKDLQVFYDSVVGPEELDLLPTLEEIEAMARAPGLTPGRRSFSRQEVDDVVCLTSAKRRHPTCSWSVRRLASPCLGGPLSRSGRLAVPGPRPPRR